MKERRDVRTAIWLLVMTVGLTVAGVAGAQSIIERLIMPGAVIGGHAKLEADCANCHGETDDQNPLCLDCHKPVAADIARSTGFHGRAPAVTGRSCKSCHTDHVGRGADIIRFNAAAFDHRRTDFELTGRHARAACATCHRPAMKYREAPARCVSCHKTDDRHAGRLGDDCAACHTANDWSAARSRFDHGKTRFALTGAHAEVPCQSCHAGERFEGTPTVCADCHAPQDVHRGRFGAKCESCHETARWKTVRFDHGIDAKFDLSGAHSKVSCNDCHLGPAETEKPGKRCIDCHADDDVHNGLNGANCKDCHNESDWTDTGFDHGRTKFPLRGAHATAPCETCHVKPAGEIRLPTTCFACHEKDDAHRGRFGRDCAACHATTRWRDVRFDHGRTKFPLRGSHAALACKACHRRPAAEVRLARDCYSCHRKDDAHKGSLGRDCAQCHTARRWRQDVFFDHGLGRFPLIGKHAPVACAKCHQTKAYSEAPERCIDCHRKDDTHKGGLGEDCAACHNPTGWGRWLFDHAQTGFALVGGHNGLMCGDCHLAGTTGETSSRCSSCHRRDDVHRGGFGRRCERCHQASSWRDLK